MRASYDRTAFGLLSKKVQLALRKRGFEKPTEPQERVIPLILKGKNVLLIAPTASGKTEAALLPILSLMVEREASTPGIKLLYITPLRALNRDMLDRFHWWAEELGLRVGVRHGDTETAERSRQARNPPDILITTPETLQAILSGRVLRKHLASLKWVVVDEVHELVDDKRGTQLSLSMERLRFVVGHDFQVVGLSATVGSPEEVAKFLVGEGRAVEVVRVSVARNMKLKVLYVKPEPEDEELAKKLNTHVEVAARLRKMRELIEQHKSTLVFVNTRSMAEVLSSRFKVWDISLPIDVHHGSLSKSSRITAEKGLKKGELKGLVCTSSLELGIDVGTVELVIQYMSPRQVTRLIQRVGRAGHRLGLTAKGVVFTADPDDTLEAMVICRKALKEELEPVRIPEKPYDVLCHQIAALLMLKSKWKAQQIRELYAKAYPYRDLTPEELHEVLTYMHNRFPRLAWYDPSDGAVLKPRRTRFLYRYFFGHLSMIPEEKQYLVVDESSGTAIGLLDEAFMAEYGEVGVKFVFRGSLWMIKRIEGDRIYVAPIQDPTGAIPSWIGEEIPVPYEVAQEVGALRARVEELLKQGKKLMSIAKAISKEYPADLETVLSAIAEVEQQVKGKHPVPTHRRILVESLGNTVVVHTHLGTLGNRALARLLADALAELVGETIGVQQDPYRIILNSPIPLKANMVRKILVGLVEEDVEERIEEVAERTGLFKRRLIHVARRFGALPEDFDYSSVSLRKLVEAFRGTIVYKEALKELKTKDLDTQVVELFFEKLLSNDLEIVAVDRMEPSPMTASALEKLSKKLELVPPERMHRVILESAKSRLLSETRLFVCADCWSWMDYIRVLDLPPQPRCPICRSKAIGLVDLYEEKVAKVAEKMRKGSKLSKNEQRIADRIIRSAELVERYGKKAVVALVAKGLRYDEVEEILEEAKEMNDDFFQAIVEAEKRALKRRFY